MKLYLAGPMRMHKDNDYNFRAFFIAEALLEMKGHTVINPARLDIEQGKAHWSPADGRIVMAANFTMEDAMRRDILEIANGCEGIVLLPGWSKSNGALAELNAAKLFGCRIFDYLEGGVLDAR